MSAGLQDRTTSESTVSASEVQRRTIRREALVSCNQAFIDCRTPGSDRKENYALIGSGVSQSSEQVINLEVPHGFNVGGAAMPNGVTNSLHLHFTAEVFLVVAGEYKFRWGVDGGDGEFIGHAGDILSIPTWIFRGFTNVGPDENFMFTVLGRNDTGGIIWGPSVLREAEGHGLLLTAENKLVDTAAGQQVPDGVEQITPMPDDQIAALQHYSPEQLRRRVVTEADREFYDRALLCTVLPGGRAQLALVIGFGMTEHRSQEPPVYNPHGFNVAWLKAAPGEGLLTHRHQETQVLIARRGAWEITLNTEDPQKVTLQENDTLSVPPGAWRRFTNVGDTEAELVVINGSDGRVHLEWSDDVVRSARDLDLAHDANGYLAPWSLVSRSVEDD
ncbi:MAG: cupin domain-containing protein [Propionibacteriaceae bacterium]